MNSITDKKNSVEDVSSTKQIARKQAHPADIAGTMRHRFFKTDLWVVGGKEYVTPKNTVPHVLEAAFAPSTTNESKEISMRYNRDLFAIDRITGLEEGREYMTWVHSKVTGKGVVEVTLRDDTFVVKLFKGAHDTNLPFTKEEFLRALYAGKVDLELDQLGEDSDSDSDDSDTVKEPTPPSPSDSQVRKP